MSDTTYALVILLGIGLTSVAIRNVAKKAKRELYSYVGALVVAGTLGALVADQSDQHTWVVGTIMGMATVELGDIMLASAIEIVRKLLAKVSDRFADDRQPGYGNDEEA